LGTVLLVAALIVVNLFGSHIGGRLDLTPGKVYTLSSTTKQMLGNLEDIVLIKLFASRNMDPQFELMKRDINDLLGDFRSAGNGMVRLTVRDPADDPEAASDAETLGIPAIQFNVVGQGEYTVKEGYLGLAVQYAGETETIPVVTQPENLEYRLLSYIRDMTRESVPVVGLVEDQADQARGGGFNVLRQALGEGYEVRNINLSSDGRAGIRYFQNYPFWLRALSTRMSTVNQGIETMFLPWTSQLDTTGALPGSLTPLFVTSNYAGFEEGQAMVAPQRAQEDYPTDNLSSRLLGVMVNPLVADITEMPSDGASTALPPRGRLIVMGSGEFARDNWVRNAGSNCTAGPCV
jgi:ABC-type uncharacterized transport system involved in gliding motility auxiliary subunit